MLVRFTTVALLSFIFVTAVGCSKTPSPEELKKLNHEFLQAVDRQDVGAAHRLLDKGANVETAETDDMTPLGIAASINDLLMVQMLLQKGANAHVKDHSGLTPLMHAAYDGNAEIARLLLQQNPDHQEKNAALLEAVHNSPAVVIMENPRNDQLPAVVPSPALKPWQISSAVETVKALLDSGADIEATDQYRGPPLIDAAAYAQTDVVSLLLERGANIHAKDRYGNTALISASCECAIATMNSTFDVVKILLEKGADVNARSNDGTTPLMNAAGGFGGSAIVKILLDYGADPTAKDADGNTALKFASKDERKDKAQLIKQALAKNRKR